MDQPDLGVRHPARGGYVAAELVDDLDGLRDAGRPERVAHAQEAAAGVHRDVAVELAATLLDEPAALALLDPAQVLVFDDLRDGEAVVDLGHVELGDGVLDAGLVVGPVGRDGRLGPRGE